MAVGGCAVVTVVWTVVAVMMSTTDSAEFDIWRDYVEQVFSVPHESALLNCSLVNENVFDFLSTPYNLSWYDERTGLQITGEEEGTVMKNTALWLLDISLERQGNYSCVVRTPHTYYKQTTVLQVDLPVSGECGRPQKALQRMQDSVTDLLACPLRDYAKEVESFSIHWYKGCELLQESSKFTFLDSKLILLVRDVSAQDAGFYTCRMNFILNGVIHEVAETIKCEITASVLKRPLVIEPANEVIKVTPGSQFKKECRAFVPGNDVLMVFLNWKFKNDYVSKNSSHRVHQTPERLMFPSQTESYVAEGVWLERTLLVTSVLEEDFSSNFTCIVFSASGSSEGYFTLQPADGDLRLVIGLVLGVLALLFVMGVFVYRVFKVELTLAFRTHCPFFYESTDGDGKLYDAYVMYPRLQGNSSSEAMEMFAMKTLPQVLEGCYGYKLYILGRDSGPGQAVVDVVEETLGRCRRLLLLYTSSSLCRPEGVEWVERQMGMHQALVEGSLKVALLEMEEVREPQSLPESVRLLREKQGAVQAWQKRRRWRWRCWRREMEKDSDVEQPLSSFTLPARFWREVRYHMPVRGKAKPHSRRKVFLNL